MSNAHATILVVDDVADNRDPSAFDDMAAIPLSLGRTAGSS
jgi:hypothetical protein